MSCSTATQRTIYFSQVVGLNPPPPLPGPGDPEQRHAASDHGHPGGGYRRSRVCRQAPRVGSGYVNFIAGDHGSLLSPAASGPATVEMQTQVATFTVTGNPLTGASSPTINVANPAVVQP